MPYIDHLFRDDDSEGLCFIIYDYLENDDRIIYRPRLRDRF